MKYVMRTLNGLFYAVGLCVAYRLLGVGFAIGYLGFMMGVMGARIDENEHKQNPG